MPGAAKNSLDNDRKAATKARGSERRTDPPPEGDGGLPDGVASGRKPVQEEFRLSRKHLDLAVNAAGIGAWHYDLNAGKCYWSRQLYRLLGLEPRKGPEDLDAFFECVHPEDRKFGLNSMEAFIEKSHDSIDLSFRIIRKDDGRVRWLAGKGTVDRDAAGRPARISGVNWDITALKQKESELHSIQELLYNVTEHSLDANYIRNLKTGHHDYISPVIERLTGFSPDEIRILSARDLLALVHPDDRSRVAAEEAQAMESGEGKLEFRFNKKNGRYLWLGDFFTVQRDADGTPLQRIGVLRDITEHKHAEMALSEQKKLLEKKLRDLEQTNRELSEYAYAVSHDLKSPMRAVYNYTEFLWEDLAETLTGDQKKYLEGLKTATQQGNNLIDDLLSFSRIGRVSLEAAPVEMPDLCRALLSTLDMPSGVEVAVDPEWPDFHADPTLLKQMLGNLVTNGVKFNHSRPKRIRIGWQPAPDDRIDIFVRDNGIGIQAEYQDEVFRVFKRLHSEKEYEGTGIGLAIVYKAAHRLGGSVRLESEPGTGSTFYVRLPIRQENTR